MKSFRHFGSDRSGGVAIIFSLALLPLLGFTGLAIDYGRMLRAKADMQSAVDAGALAAGLDQTGASDAALLALAEPLIRSRMAAHKDAALTNVSARTRGGEVEISATARMPNVFGALFGAGYANISAMGAVPKRVGKKQDLYFLLDASASMGLAATPAGRDALINLVGCAFACHDPEGGQTKSNLEVAQENGVVTRVDVLRNAVGGMIDKMITRKTALDTFRVAIDIFDDSPRQAVPLTTDLQSAKNYLVNYRLGGNASFSSAMPTFAADVGQQGDGLNAPEKYAILVTDGVQGRRDRVGGFHPFDASLCQDIKGRNITLIVLNTKYIPMPTEAPYQQTVAPIQSRLEPALRNCASPGWYFSATDQAEILDAFNHIDKAIQSAKLRISR